VRAGLPQLLVVLAIVLLFFGARRLPDLAGSLGRSLREFRDGAKLDEDAPARDGTPEDDTSPSSGQGS
jgi:sec-independent protein translocase protein TatA